MLQNATSFPIGPRNGLEIPPPEVFSIDGPGNILAHAFYPYEMGSWGGDVHFDEAENWQENATDLTKGVDFYTVALHELGHSLVNKQLDDDIENENEDYDSKEASSELEQTTELTTSSYFGDSTKGEKVNIFGDYRQTIGLLWTIQSSTLVQGFARQHQTYDACYERFDKTLILFAAKNNRTYLFADTIFWRLNDELKTLDKGYPKSMSRWPGLPENIDAAATLPSGKTYFFKDNRYWLYNNFTCSPERGYPRRASTAWLRLYHKNKTFII
ncbi:Matrix metalloproteinase-14 [Eumeta japonica]|uniref:Matrix metalloproteinase-14 n=1 Tax=Eumeta variegata TaxID=151549 RepID=A0A4C1TQ45_EUMVA|nr:Matrix metalloproteinase-14 [Eumeta japonica]